MNKNPGVTSYGGFRQGRGGFRDGYHQERSRSNPGFRGRGRGGFRSSSIDANVEVNSRATSNHSNVQRGVCHSRQRMYPIGYKKLEELLNSDPYLVSEELLRRNSGLDVLLENDIEQQKFLLLLRVLQRACCTRANSEGVAELLMRILNHQRFVQSLTTLISDIKYEASVAQKYLPIVAEIVGEFMRLAPASAFKSASNVTDVCVAALYHLKSEEAMPLEDLEQKVENLKLQVKESRVQFQESRRATTNTITAPPNNFRDIPSQPTPAEITAVDRPFIRPIVIEGGFQDANHYLDVHFRLLKEDFLRPLREGLNFYLSGGDTKKCDARIYPDVVLNSSELEKSEVVYYLKLNIRKGFRIENTKRLMFGNILCISHDNFETMIIASVSNKDYLKDKLLGVKIETANCSLEYNRKYTVVESKAYFVSYKYTMDALKRLDSVPFNSYVVQARENGLNPDYLERFTKYVFPSNTVIRTALRNMGVVDVRTNIDDDLEVCLLDDLRFWPTAAELKLDESQRRALHGALTSQVAIIQGPPGTGKTFLGLKITEILLTNQKEWNKDKKHPILVVCYTNHALDQFLEGMLKFTDSIVRIGSQSKNEALREYQISKHLYRSSKFNRFEVDVINKNYHEIRIDLKNFKLINDAYSNVLKDLQKPGIFLLQSITSLSAEAISQKCQKQLQRNKGTLRYYLFESMIESIAYECSTKDNVKNPEIQSSETSENTAMDTDNSNEANIDEEIMKEEEYNRQLDEDEDYDDETETESTPAHVHVLRFERTPHNITSDLFTLEAQIDKNPFHKNNRVYHNQIQVLNAEFRTMSTGCTLTCNEEEGKKLEQSPDIWKLGLAERWRLYYYWKLKLINVCLKRKEALQKECVRLTKRMDTIKDLKYLQIMKDSAIVGMTTTGAAQYCNLLHDLAPPIVIVEEAAEIMEAHIISSLSTKCQHLILIGDHKQLRPKPNVYELGLKYHLDVSLFERMIMNNIKYETLEYQHRMKPLFSQLLVPSVYSELKDHPSVEHYPKIKGVQKDLFFLNHTQMENAPFDDEESFENLYEGEFLMGLCRHLILQGYEKDDVTIITPYSGQYRCLRRLQRQDQFYACEGVRISILDNYQGEESNIILLSLVRSNATEKVGFMKIDNRICVALSRAKHGMYIIGNMTQMSNASSLWTDVNEKLMKSGHIGTELGLICERHSQDVSMVSSYQDILSKSPEGGCTRKCSAILPLCKHPCPRLCHVIESDHKGVKCTLKCTKILCNLGHVCPRLCYQSCNDCQVKVEKFLPCGHTHSIACHIDPKDFLCPTKVTRELPCTHVITLNCSEDVNRVRCPNKCTIRLDCGHQCKRSCHINNDPTHEDYDCHEPCGESPKNCERGHKCRKKCYEDCGICTELVTRRLSCGHSINNVACGKPEDSFVCPGRCKRVLPCGHFCTRKCADECGGCKVQVEKVFPACNHPVKMACGLSPSTLKCSRPCVKKLDCGHQCKRRCKDTCSSSTCEELIPSNAKCPRGHTMKLPCHLLRSGEKIHDGNTLVEGRTFNEYCTEVCGMMLDCQHTCQGQCGQCYNGRLHVNCRAACKKTLVCGHVCKEPCSTDCPPCQQGCLWRCSHSRCFMKCGIVCKPCKERCDRNCAHSACSLECGAKCDREPCDKPCPKKLKCDHDCIGFCGEPCPPKCRICDGEEITEIFFGDEDEENARFVMLEDCYHIFEWEGLKGWMNTSSEDGQVEIGMKKCPRCSVAIYNTRRLQAFIVDAFVNVLAVKRKHFRTTNKIKKSDLIEGVKQLKPHWPLEVSDLLQKLNLNINFLPMRKQIAISNEELGLLAFQIKFLEAAKVTREKLKGNENRLKNLIELVMKNTVSVSPQLMEEASCELRRLEVCVAINKLQKDARNDELKKIIQEIDTCMNPTTKFDVGLETKVVDLLKKAENYVGGLGITKQERLEIVQAMGFKQGHWYACPNGHIYCIADCGGAVTQSRCPECNSVIGGEAHRLHSSNRVATEMDGATRSAWPGGA